MSDDARQEQGAPDEGAENTPDPAIAVPPLAPPLGGSAPAAPPPPPVAPAANAAPPAVPPYARPAYLTPGADGQASPPPPAPMKPRRTAAWVPLVIAGIAFVIALVTILFFSGVTLTSPGGAVPSAPSAPVSPADPADPAAPADADAGEIEALLQGKIDEYRGLRDSGRLWERIEDTEFNRTAVSAFLYLLTDMKVATMWGVDDATAAEYAQRAAELEERLLTGEPLGDDIHITFETREFTYDGETGEGGYTDR